MNKEYFRSPYSIEIGNILLLKFQKQQMYLLFRLVRAALPFLDTKEKNVDFQTNN